MPVRLMQAKAARLCAGRARAAALAFLFCSWLIAASADACICACESSTYRQMAAAGTRTVLGHYDEVFSGWILSTQRVNNPSISGGATFQGTETYPYYWVRSKVLVVRIWRGAPSVITEVWTPGGNSCDMPMLAGIHFVALVSKEGDRRIARQSMCDCGITAAATTGRGAYTAAGLTLLAILGSVVAFLLLWLSKTVRRRMFSKGRQP